jgi:hypothetical protein
VNLKRDPGPDFIRNEYEHVFTYMHREIEPFADELLIEIDEQMRSGGQGLGNRGSGYPVSVEGTPPLFVRRSVRGGLMRFLGQTYLGFNPRMVYELWVLSEARKRGVPVPEPMGAIVENVRLGVYRGALITKALTGMTLWEFVQTETDSLTVSHVVRLARYAIDMMHEHGIFHDDINLNNLFVSTGGDGFSVVILDFDKGRVFSNSLPTVLRRLNFWRLGRSIRKLDRKKRFIDDEMRYILTAPQE